MRTVISHFFFDDIEILIFWQQTKISNRFTENILETGQFKVLDHFSFLHIHAKVNSKYFCVNWMFWGDFKQRL